MPPQNNATQTPPHSQFSVDSLKHNQRFMTTLKTFITYVTILNVVNIVIAMILSALAFARYYYGFNAMGIVMAILGGIIGGIISALIFEFLYNPIHNWVKSNVFLSKHIHDMFTLLWKPYFVITVIMAVISLLGLLSLGSVVVAAGAYGAVGFGSLFVGWLISYGVNVAVYYWFAKTISAKLTPLYPW